MASIHRDPRGKSPYWYVSYRTPNGRQHFRSTKATERRKAGAFARAIEASLDKAKIGSLTETAARSILADLYQHINGRELLFVSIEGWFETCLQQVRHMRGKAAFRRYRKVIEHFLEILGPIRSKAPLESLTSDEIQRFADRRLEEGRTPTTVEADLKPLGKFLRDAQRKGVTLQILTGAVDLPNTPGESRDPFSETERFALLSYLAATTNRKGRPHRRAVRERKRNWRTAVYLGLYLGTRLGDCTNLHWSNVDFLRKQVRFIPEKNRRRQELIIPMHPDLESHLMELPATDKTDGYLCPVLGGRKGSKRSGLSSEFSSILRGARINRRAVRSKTGRGRTFYRLSFHSLRHTFNSLMADAGVSIELRAKLSGHTTYAMNNRYTHFADSTKRRAIETIPSMSERLALATSEAIAANLGKPVMTAEQKVL